MLVQDAKSTSDDTLLTSDEPLLSKPQSSSLVAVFAISNEMVESKIKLFKRLVHLQSCCPYSTSNLV
jgi:hypothetical protein